jgi:TP901 family phage tail tape measure protein
MAFGSDRAANFVVKAKDAATGPLGKIGGSMGKLKSAGVAAFKAIGAAALAAGAAIVAFAVDGIKNAAAFQTAMLNVNSIAKATPEAFKEMQDAVLELSKRLPQSAETLAQGLYDISSSGFAGADGIKVLEAAAKAASAGLAETSESAAGITAVLNSYSLSADDAQRVSDVLFKTVDRGVITFPELAAEIGKTTALASPLGVSLEEVAAGIAVLTKNGIDASNATTQLNAIMTAILKPSSQASKYAASYGIELSATALESKGLSGMLNEMIKKTKGSSEALSMILGNARAIRGAFVLAKDSGAQFNEELALMQNAAGATDTALSYQEQGLAYQLKILGNNVDAVGIKLGEKFIPKLTEVTNWLMKEGLPAFEGFLESLEPIVTDLTDNYIGPLFDSVTELFTLFDDSDFSILELALVPVKASLSALKIIVEAIVAAIKFIKGAPEAFAQVAAQAPRNYQTGGYTTGEMGGPSAYLQTATRNGVSPMSTGYGVAPVSLTIGTQAQNTLAYKYGQGVKASTGTRTGGR